MNAFKKQCIDLRKRDYTLPQIMKLTGRSKTSVYYHIKNIPLSEKKLNVIQEATRKRAGDLSAKRRGLSARPFSQFKTWTRSEVRLTAHLLFDGEIKRFGCVYHNRNPALLRIVENSMRKMYVYPPKRFLNRSTGVSRISYYNVALGFFMRKKAEELLRTVEYMPRHLKREFLCSFFDDEGCIDFRPESNHRRVRGYQKNVKILFLVQKLLRDLGIQAHYKKPNEIVIVEKETLSLLQRQINFLPDIRLNGSGPNSIWKRDVEKRILLNLAIASYKPEGSNGVHRGKLASK